MQRYKKYKDSGIEWIGEIPEEWEVKKLKYLFKFHDSQRIPLSADVRGKMLDKQYDYYGASGVIGRVESFIFDGEYILLGEDGANLLTRSTALAFKATGQFWVNNHAHILTPIRGNLDYFVNYLESIDYVNSVSGSAQPKLTAEALGFIDVIAPPESEQTTIANYLDHKTAKIDQLIVQKEALISLYEEEKTAIINQAVTQGINPDVKLKKSAIDWLRDIPRHWEVKKLKFLISSLESGVSVNSMNFPAADKSYGILKTSCVYKYTFEPSKNKEIWQSELIRAKIKPRKGEIIISRMNTPELVGASGYVDKDYEYLYLPDRLWQTVFKSGISIDTKWLSYVLKSIRFRMLLSFTATGSSPSMKNLTQEDFMKITVPFPVMDEQAAIVHHIETQTARINAKINKTKKIIALQKEYRTALISEVVTGKIKVTREMAS